MTGSSVEYSEINNLLEQLTNSHVVPKWKVLGQSRDGNGIGICGQLIAQALQQNRSF